VGDLSGEGGQWLDGRSEAALRATVPQFMPPVALAGYARWWQFETWLRDLVYVEFRAMFGVEWVDMVNAQRQGKDATSLQHMPSADSENPLAYLDTTPLFELLDYDWSVFEPSFIDRIAWQGRKPELLKIRHRIMHLRKPHVDDLTRLDQVLRDLEHDAKAALVAYTSRRKGLDPRSQSDPVTVEWSGSGSRVSTIRHADTVYGALVEVSASKRPWLASWPAHLNGASGVLWHLNVIFRDRTIDPRALWRELPDPQFRNLLVHLLIHDPYHVEFVFAGVDDGSIVARAMGYAVETALYCAHYVRSIDDVDYEHNHRTARDIDYRVLSGSAWGLVDADYFGSIFGA
jgi:hypothetical protein